PGDRLGLRVLFIRRKVSLDRSDLDRGRSRAGCTGGPAYGPPRTDHGRTDEHHPYTASLAGAGSAGGGPAPPGRAWSFYGAARPAITGGLSGARPKGFEPPTS